MSVATEISRIQADRNTIRNKLIELGLATGTAKLDALASAIEGIVNVGSVSISVQEGETYTIPAGYHPGTGTVSGVAGGGNYTLQSKSVTPSRSRQSITRRKTSSPGRWAWITGWSRSSPPWRCGQGMFCCCARTA